MSGCSPFIAPANFAARSDSTIPGDLLGPFDGRVVDSSTGKPVSGALVYATWSFESGLGFSAPAGAIAKEVETDADGRYFIRRLRRLPGPRARVMGFRIIVYKPSYVAYRSDRHFTDLQPRHNFTQSGNEAKLERFSPNLSHVRHVRFVGGGGGLRRALQPEIVQASLELSESQGKSLLGDEPAQETPAAGGETKLEQLLPADELALETDAKSITPIPGKTLKYNAVGQTVAELSLITLADKNAAKQKFDALLNEISNADERNEMGERSLRGGEGDTYVVAALVQNQILQLSCTILCRDSEQVAKLLKRAVGRLQKTASPTEKGTRSDDDLEPVEFPDEESAAPKLDEKKTPEKVNEKKAPAKANVKKGSK